MNDDLELIQAAENGDIESFSELVLRYQDSIRSLLAVRLNRHHEAEDLAQDTFITAYKKLSEFDKESAFGPWLRGIAINLLRNHWRKAREKSVGGIAELDIIFNEAIEESKEQSNHSLEALSHCVNKLEGDAKDLVQWRYFLGLSLKEICTRLKKKHSAITMKLHRLRNDLKECVEQSIQQECPE